MFMTLLASMFILFVLEDEVKCISRRRAASARRRATNPAPTARRRSTNPKPPGGSGGSSTDCDKSIGNAVACAALEQMTQSAVEKIWNTGRRNLFRSFHCANLRVSDRRKTVIILCFRKSVKVR